jgi:hypothetical protein
MTLLPNELIGTRYQLIPRVFPCPTCPSKITSIKNRTHLSSTRSRCNVKSVQANDTLCIRQKREHSKFSGAHISDPAWKAPGQNKRRKSEAGRNLWRWAGLA